ncbi:hypothetical protein D3C81_1962120 [compost metagenome]
MWRHCDDKDKKSDGCNGGNDKHDLEGFTCTFKMNTHKNQIADEINDPSTDTK